MSEHGFATGGLVDPDQTGSTCHQCGTYVPMFITHHCMAGVTSVPVSVMTQGQFDLGTNPDFMPQIAESLDRIAVALERLANHFAPTMSSRRST